MVFVLAGLSPGAGSLIGGRLHRGFGGAAGEIGALHLLGREATPETSAVDHGRAAAPAGRGGGRRGCSRRAREGDEQARAAVDRFIQRLVHDVAALVLALDPELVVVGGWAAGLDGVLQPLRDELARYCLRPPGWPCRSSARRPWRRVRCGWRSTMSRSSCSRWRGL